LKASVSVRGRAVVESELVHIVQEVPVEGHGGVPGVPDDAVRESPCTSLISVSTPEELNW
jgi:hypothetical protein